LFIDGRANSFIDGRANSADRAQAVGYPEFSAEREGDLHLGRVGNERYAIPEAVVLGG